VDILLFYVIGLVYKILKLQLDIYLPPNIPLFFSFLSLIGTIAISFFYIQFYRGTWTACGRNLINHLESKITSKRTQGRNWSLKLAQHSEKSTISVDVFSTQPDDNEALNSIGIK